MNETELVNATIGIVDAATRFERLGIVAILFLAVVLLSFMLYKVVNRIILSIEKQNVILEKIEETQSLILQKL